MKAARSEWWQKENILVPRVGQFFVCLLLSCVLHMTVEENRVNSYQIFNTLMDGAWSFLILPSPSMGYMLYGVGMALNTRARVLTI